MNKCFILLILITSTFFLFSCKETTEVVDTDSLPATKEEIQNSLEVYMSEINDVNETVYTFEPGETQQNFVKDIYLKEEFTVDEPDSYYYKNHRFVPNLDSIFNEIQMDLDSIADFKTGTFIDTNLFGDKILFHVQDQLLRIVLTSIDENEEDDEQKDINEIETVKRILDLKINADGTLSYKYLRYSNKIDHEYVTYYEINEGKNAFYFNGQGATDIEYLYLDMTTNNVTEYLRIPNSLSEYSEYYYYFDNASNLEYFAFFINEILQTEHISRYAINTMIFTYSIRHEETKKADLMWNMTYVDDWESLTIRESSQSHYYVGDYFTVDGQNYFSDDTIYAFVEWGNPKIILCKEFLYEDINDSVISLEHYGMQYQYTEDTQIALEGLLTTYIESISGDLFYDDVIINTEDSHIFLIDYLDDLLYFNE
ncbi:MAG: hypothetical protein KKH01_05235 [Firmicutes bacterium]|nr:hypothetical protein [Bacillota bacterium]